MTNNKIKRFSSETINWSFHGGRLIASADGEWVRYSDVRASLKASQEAEGVATHRHLKSGHLVRVIGIGRMQSASWIDEAKPAPVDMREVVIYQHDGNLWARPAEEFNDGRFESLASPQPAPDTEGRENGFQAPNLCEDCRASALSVPAPGTGGAEEPAAWQRFNASAQEWLDTPADEIERYRRLGVNVRPLFSTPQAGDLGAVTLGTLQRAHIERQEEWCPDQKPDLSFRGNEMAGEVGEACNVIKKLERERQGWRGSRATKEQLAEELADVIHTAILCAITAGIDIEPATLAKFNATSEKNGLSTRILSAISSSPVGEMVLVPDGDPVTLDDCPEGLFLFGKILAVMTEYATYRSDIRQRDAYIVESGEYFWGGTSYVADRAKLIVQPLATAPQGGR